MPLAPVAVVVGGACGAEEDSMVVASAVDALLAMSVVVAVPAPALPYTVPYAGCRHYTGALDAAVCATWLAGLDQEVEKWEPIGAGQPDGKRLSGRLPESSEVVVALSGYLGGMGELGGRVCVDPYALRSMPGCRVQKPHVDFNSALVSEIPVGGRKPASVLLALESGSRLFFGRRLNGPDGDVMVALGAGDVLVFEGDVPHYGSDYLIRNTRVHLYLDLIGVEMRVENESYLYR